MNLAVCIPWMGGDAHRERAFEWCQRWWEHKGFDPHIGQGPSRSAARNDAACNAIAAGATALFFADADTFCGGMQVADAYVSAVTTGRLVTAFTKFHRIPKMDTATQCVWPPKNLSRYLGSIVTTTSSFAVGGLVAISVELWQQIGGYDERFTDWGFEDRSIWFAAKALAGEPLTVNGHGYHWWHPAPISRTVSKIEELPGFELAMRYKTAAGVEKTTGILPRCKIDPIQVGESAMLAVLSEPGGPLGVN